MRRWLGKLLADRRLRAILKDAGLTTLSGGISSVFTIIRTAIMARYLGVELFGVWALVSSANTVAQKLLSVRTWEWVMVNMSKAFVGKDGPAAGAVWKAGVAIGATVNAVALAAVMVLAPWIAETFLKDAALASLLRLNALSLFISFADEACVAAQRVMGRFRWLAGYQVAASLARLVSVLPVVWLGGGVRGMIYATIAAQVTASGALVPITMAELKRRFADVWKGRLGTLWADRRAHGRTLITLSVTDTIKVFIADADAFLIGYFGTPAAIGVYRAAQQVVIGLQQLTSPYYMVFYPEMTKAAAEGDPRRMRTLVRQMTIVGTAIGGSVALGLTLFAPLAVHLLYGKGYEPSVHLLQIMIWSLLTFAAAWANPMFVSLGRPVLTLWLMMIGVVVKIVLIALLVPRWSAYGAAIAYTAHLLVIIPAAVVLARLVKMRPPVEAAA